MLSLYHQRVKPQVYQAQFKSNSNIRLAQAEGDARKEKALDPIREKMGNLQYERQQRNYDVQMFQQGLQLGKLAFNVYDNYKTAKEANELSSANLEVQKLLQGASDLIKLDPNQSVDYAQSLDANGNVVRGRKSQDLYNQALQKGEKLKGLNKTKFEQSLYSNFSQFQNSVDTIDMSETLEIANTNYKEFYKSTLESPGSIEEKLAQHKDYLNNSVEAGIITRSTAQKLDLDFADKAETRAFSNMADNLMGVEGSGDLSLFEEQVRNSKYLSEEQENEIIANAHELKEARQIDAQNREDSRENELVEADIKQKEDKYRKNTLTMSEIIQTESHNLKHSKELNRLKSLLIAKTKKPEDESLEDYNPVLFEKIQRMMADESITIEGMRDYLRSEYEKEDNKNGKYFSATSYLKFMNKAEDKLEDNYLNTYKNGIINLYSSEKNDSHEVKLSNEIKRENALNNFDKLIHDIKAKALKNGQKPSEAEIRKYAEEFTRNLQLEDLQIERTVGRIDDRDISRSMVNGRRMSDLEDLIVLNNKGYFVTIDHPNLKAKAEARLKTSFNEILDKAGYKMSSLEQEPNGSYTFKIKGIEGKHRFEVVNGVMQLQKSLKGSNFTRTEYEEKKPGDEYKTSQPYTGGKTSFKDITKILNKDQLKEIKERISNIESKNLHAGNIGQEWRDHELNELASEFGLNIHDWNYQETAEILRKAISNKYAGSARPYGYY